MTTLYGIPNCDTIKKARRWLDDNNIEFEFHNFKKDGLDPSLLDRWFKDIGWEVLLNKRGTTWRKLDDSIKNTVDETSAKVIMLENPSIIKRPVLDLDTTKSNSTKHVGFNESEYTKIFS
ncbi:MAG: ArsC family reductase [Gammaproteobacteria bacterium]|nr:ArsC family reductase [Gammaproteobacteria bacterium]